MKLQGLKEIIRNMGSMESQIVENTESYVALLIKVPYSSNMLESEEYIQNSLNEAGKQATECALSRYDTDGSPIKVAKTRYTSKGLSPKHYQTPYGEIYLQRHVYQNSSGGTIYCPLEQDAHITGGTTTPRFAKMVSSKYSRMGSDAVKKDLQESNGRSVARCYIQDISESVGQAVDSRPGWTYTVPVTPNDVSTIGISLDGTCMLICGDGYRQAMVGSISLYDREGKRLYTRYSAMPPESGKSRFYESFTGDIKSIKRLYPKALYVGVADGAADNWTFLAAHVQHQILDYFHAAEYLSSVSQAAFKRPFEGKVWFEKAKQVLRDEKDGAKELIKEMNLFLKKRITEARKEKIQAAITYFNNHWEQMDYRQFKKSNLPIGSGVIEAACKVIIKQRLCCAGMKWTDAGAKTVLTLRCLNESETMWEQFWDKKCKNIR
jgi:hypothetical protein